MESQITFDHEADLSVPAGMPLKSISVRVTIEPADASILIYGWTADGKVTGVHVSGGPNEVRLPFVKPHVWIKYLGGLQTLQIATLGAAIDR